MKKLVAIILVSAIVMALATGCGKKEEKVLNIGTSAEFQPFEYVDTAKGSDIIGFDVDIANYIGQELGYKIKMVDMPFDSLVTALKGKKVDLVLAGMSVTPARQKEIDFSDVYFTTNNLLVTKKDSGITTADQLKGKKVGVQTGSTQQTKGEELAKTVDLTLSKLDRVPDLIQELQSGRTDAVILEEAASGGYLKKFTDLQGNIISKEDESGFAIGIQKDSKLKEDVNKALKKLKDSGEYDKLVKKWFNS